MTSLYSYKQDNIKKKKNPSIILKKLYTFLIIADSGHTVSESKTTHVSALFSTYAYKANGTADSHDYLLLEE